MDEEQSERLKRQLECFLQRIISYSSFFALISLLFSYVYIRKGKRTKILDIRTMAIAMMIPDYPT